ncbi:MAG: hypothetical protein A2046_04115 [Bacteroidetes bacterium GWA2_30_7]|nr:MAG: hypothetical protein A2046_04115 [Bacteroidetes bacterium GWA2_30_7]
MENLQAPDKNNLLKSIVDLIDNSRNKVALAVNSELTLLYWNIGKQINEDILKNSRADYGKKIVFELSQELTKKYGTGFSKKNLHNFIKFNELYPDIQIVQTVSAQLSWSHIYSLIYITDDIKREFYIQMCIHERWSVRTLQGRIDSMLYERTAISKKPEQTIIKYILLWNTDDTDYYDFHRISYSKLKKIIIYLNHQLYLRSISYKSLRYFNNTINLSKFEKKVA